MVLVVLSFMPKLAQNSSKVFEEASAVLIYAYPKRRRSSAKKKWSNDANLDDTHQVTTSTQVRHRPLTIAMTRRLEDSIPKLVHNIIREGSARGLEQGTQGSYTEKPKIVLKVADRKEGQDSGGRQRVAGVGQKTPSQNQRVTGGEQKNTSESLGSATPHPATRRLLQTRDFELIFVIFESFSSLSINSQARVLTTQL